MIIACDVDGVIANSYPSWLARYHRDHPNSPRIEIHEVYSQKAKNSKEFLAYLNEPDFYDEVEEVPGAWNGVVALRAWGHRVVFVTSAPQGQTDPKWQWMQRGGFLSKGKMQERDLVICHDKRLIKADLIIEDSLHQVEGWGERAILLDQPYNQDKSTADYIRVYSWPEIVQAVENASSPRPWSLV